MSQIDRDPLTAGMTQTDRHNAQATARGAWSLNLLDVPDAVVAAIGEQVVVLGNLRRAHRDNGKYETPHGAFTKAEMGHRVLNAARASLRPDLVPAPAPAAPGRLVNGWRHYATAVSVRPSDVSDDWNIWVNADGEFWALPVNRDPHAGGGGYREMSRLLRVKGIKIIERTAA